MRPRIGIKGTKWIKVLWRGDGIVEVRTNWARQGLLVCARKIDGPEDLVDVLKWLGFEVVRVGRCVDAAMLVNVYGNYDHMCHFQVRWQ